MHAHEFHAHEFHTGMICGCAALEDIKAAASSSGFIYFESK
jgi:hypothetical protein